jgi:predicted RNA-binding protein YlxR (DUF448 family)
MNTTRPHKAPAQKAGGWAGPRRTCVGCRQVDAQHALVRVTAEGRCLLVDGRHRRPGRGAYLHARATCLTTAEKGGFSRSFRRSISRDAITLIRQHILDVQSEGSDD